MKEVTKISELSNKTSHGCVTAGWLKTTKAWLGASFDVTVRSRAEPTKCVFWCGHRERDIYYGLGSDTCCWNHCGAYYCNPLLNEGILLADRAWAGMKFITLRAIIMTFIFVFIFSLGVFGKISSALRSNIGIIK